MSKFLCIHTVPAKAVTIQQVQQISQAAQTDKVVKGQRSFGSLAEGKIACVFEAPSKQDVAEFFENKNMPVDAIIQMDFEGSSGNVVRL